MKLNIFLDGNEEEITRDRMFVQLLPKISDEDKDGGMEGWKDGSKKNDIKVVQGR